MSPASGNARSSRNMTEPTPAPPVPQPTDPAPTPAPPVPHPTTGLPEFADGLIDTEASIAEPKDFLNDRYVVLDAALTVWASGKHDPIRPHTIEVKRGRVIPRTKVAFDLDEYEAARRIADLLLVGAIARVDDVRSGKVHVPSESPLDVNGRAVAPEKRPQTLIQRINNIRAMEGDNTPIQDVVIGRNKSGEPIYLVKREMIPFVAQPDMVAELVPAAQGV